MSANEQGLVRLVAAFFRHIVLLSLIFVATLLLAFVVTLALPKQYSSEMKILVQNTRETEAVSSSRDAAPQQSANLPNSDTRVNSEIELLSDTDLMEQLVVFRSKLFPQEGPAPETGSKQMGLAINRMRGRFEFEPVRKSEVFTAVYTDLSPELAQSVLKELERIYLEKHVQLSRPAGAFSFFNTEATAYGARLSDAERQLAEFQAANQFVALDKEKESLADNLNTLSVTAMGEQAQLQALNGRIQTITGELHHLDGRITTVIAKTPNQQGAQNLIAVLTDLRNRKVHLAENLRPGDRALQELDAQIQNTEAALTDLREHDATQVSTDVNPTTLSLQQQLEGLQADRVGVEDSFRVHQAQIDTYQDRLHRLQDITPRNDELERNVAEMKGVAQSVADKRDSARIGDLLDAGQFGNIAVAQEPTFSRQHVKPHLSVNLLLGAVTGLFLCITALLGIESLRTTVLSPSDLEKISGAPILATVPDLPSLAAGVPPQDRPFRQEVQPYAHT